MKRRILLVVSIIFLILSLGVFSVYSGLTVLNKKRLFAALETKIHEYNGQLSGEYSFIAKDFSFPYLEFSIDKDKKFPAASLIKVPLLAVALKAVDEGKFSLEEEIVFKRKDITGGSGIIKGMKLPATLSLKEVLRLSIARSDNTATNKIIDMLGFEYINQGFKDLGLQVTVLNRKMMDFAQRRKGRENYTTISDIVIVLDKIYNKQLVNKWYSELALSFLKGQKVNDRLPRYLPEQVEVAHKTGLERGVVHDVGIVFCHKGDYIVGVLTKGVRDHKEAKKFIAKLSLETYNLYQRD